MSKLVAVIFGFRISMSTRQYDNFIQSKEIVYASQVTQIEYMLVGNFCVWVC